MAKVTGRIIVTVNGVQLLNKAGFQAQGIGESGKPPVKREPIIGDTGVHGDKETIVAARCTGSITDRDDIMLSEFAKIQGNGTVVFKAASGGKVYTLDGATCAGDLSVTGGEGEVKIEFYGNAWIESTSQS